MRWLAYVSLIKYYQCAALQEAAPFLAYNNERIKIIDKKNNKSDYKN
jgi:hypothetical protein